MPKTRLGTYTSRGIESRMCDAVADIRDWHESNTEVKCGVSIADSNLPCARVYLHGHHIATLYQDRHDHLRLQVMRDTFAQWPTPTTISRLRALGAAITQIKGVVYLDGIEVGYATKLRR